MRERNKWSSQRVCKTNIKYFIRVVGTFISCIIQQDQEFTDWEREKERLTYSSREECYNPGIDVSESSCQPTFRWFLIVPLWTDYSTAVVWLMFSVTVRHWETHRIVLSGPMPEPLWGSLFRCCVCVQWYLFSAHNKWMPRLNCLFQCSEFLFLWTRRQCYCVTGKKCCFDCFWKLRSSYLWFSTNEKLWTFKNSIWLSDTSG